MIARIANAVLRRAGYEVNRLPTADEMLPRDMSADEREIWRRVSPFTMTLPERVMTLVRAVRHISQGRITGDIVECGVWRGGSMMAAALTLMSLNDVRRDLFLFDTYEGMPRGDAVDVDVTGRSANEHLDAAATMNRADRLDHHVLAWSPLEAVKQNLHSTGYPSSQMHFVVGRVEETIPAGAPGRIALLRLDTDWYQSTRHELEHLYPRLAPGGILIIDDYGHWQGARQAVDEYFQHGATPFLSRIDYGARLVVKPADYAAAAGDFASSLTSERRHDAR